MEAYCVECRAKREGEEAEVMTVKNERLAAQDVYPPCVGLKCLGWGRGEADTYPFVTVTCGDPLSRICQGISSIVCLGKSGR